MFELVDSPVRDTFDISLQLLGSGLDPIESVLSRAQVQHMTSLNIHSSRDWQRDPYVDLRLIVIDGSDAQMLEYLRREPPLESGPVTILLLINANKTKLDQLPISRECIVDTQIHFNGSEAAIYKKIDQFYRFLLSTVEFDHRLVCMDWADIRCVLLLSRRLEFRGLCPSEVGSLEQAAGRLLDQFSPLHLQRAKSLLFYEHSSAAMEGGRDIEGFGAAGDSLIEAVSDECCSVMSMGYQMPEYGPGIAGLLIGLNHNSADGC